jgi:transcriptional regulator with GAF, ATPase, and Fis domain
MKLDENQFFREATLRICSSLDIEKVLWRFLVYVRDFIPSDFVMMTHVSTDIKGWRAIASATLEGGRKLDIFYPLPPETIDQWTKSSPEMLIVDDPNTHPALKYTFLHHSELENPSIIIARLIIEGRSLGSLIIMAEGNGRYTDKHLSLLSLIREPASIALSNILRYIKLLKLKELLADDNRYLHRELSMQCGEEIVGADFGLKDVMDLVRQVAPLNSPVLLFGETGTGKEVIARAIHDLSLRSNGPFIKVNCGAIPSTLIDSELFGHERGAFTGALSQKRGRFERAHGGTIFLDEIGELSTEAQVRLLRVLQEKEIERVGGTQALSVDIRVIAATHRDLQSMIRENRFREDLFFRLQVFPIFIPPLADRKDDIPALVHHFILKKSRDMGLENISALAEDALDRLRAYEWPGNVRELENSVERAIILSRGKPLTFDDLPVIQRQGRAATGEFDAENPHNLDAAMRKQIQIALEKTDGIISGKRGAAVLLGVNASTLRARMRKLGIPFGRKSKN